jgi:hypothetical protein
VNLQRRKSPSLGVFCAQSKNAILLCFIFQVLTLVAPEKCRRIPAPPYQAAYLIFLVA